MTTPAPTPPPFDAELAAALEVLREEMPTRFAEVDIPARRAEYAGRELTDEDLRHGGDFEFEELTVPGPADGPEVRLLVCRPVRGAAGAIYYVHGGGMILGSERSPDLAYALDWAAELGLAVISVGYRLAPEHPHPAPVEDCYAGLEWTAGQFGTGPIVLAGVSAGGGLAAATALLARDRGGPELIAQMLLCPMLDDRNDSASARQMTGLGIWDSAANEVGWTALLGDRRGTADVSPYAAPARAGDLSGLPPAFIDVGSAETFRDEAVEYATRVWQAGGQAELHVWPGGFHGFDGLAPQAAVSAAARAPRLPWLRRVLGA
ncbi:alpha/beta hydrolase [Amycolatopsis magusensis]|uniref:alpha/beta hydrolase n=1 Tax=Amycolatopsis magusensis TaxID=882444 RepID=UPI0037A1C007